MRQLQMPPCIIGIDIVVSVYIVKNTAPNKSHIYS